MPSSPTTDLDRFCDFAKRFLTHEADDREALLNRALLKPVPRTVSDRYAPRFGEAAKRLHADFWERHDGPASPLDAS